MSGCLLCLHLDLGLKTGFEFKVEVVFVNRDPFDQPPDHPFVVIRHQFLMLIQKGFEFSFIVAPCRQFLCRDLHLAWEHEPQVMAL